MAYRTGPSQSDGRRETVVENGGTVWLTDQIEIDPDIDDVPFALDGSVHISRDIVFERLEGRTDGFETTENATLDLDFAISFGNDAIAVRGGVVTKGSGIFFSEGVGHTQVGDGDGTLTLRYNGTTHSVSFEEWRQALEVDGWLDSWFAIATGPEPATGPQSCDPSDFICPSGECVGADDICDGRRDCSDGWNESTCGDGDCSFDEYTCSDGECIPDNWVCDGGWDCRDGSDEDFCGGGASRELCFDVCDILESCFGPFDGCVDSCEDSLSEDAIDCALRSGDCDDVQLCF